MAVLSPTMVVCGQKGQLEKSIVCANVDSIASKSLKVTVEYDNDLPNHN